MSLTISLEKPITGNSGGGGNFPRVGHAYIAELTTIEENGNYINCYLKGNNYTAGRFDAISFRKTDTKVIERITKFVNNLVASNEALDGAKGSKQIDLSKLANKGYLIGVVYKAKQENMGTPEAPDWQDTKWVTPAFTITTSFVEDFDPDMDAYNAHQAKFWGAEEETAAAAAPVVETVKPTEDELPF